MGIVVAFGRGVVVGVNTLSNYRRRIWVGGLALYVLSHTQSPCNSIENTERFFILHGRYGARGPFRNSESKFIGVC